MVHVYCSFIFQYKTADFYTPNGIAKEWHETSEMFTVSNYFRINQKFTLAVNIQEEQAYINKFWVCTIFPGIKYSINFVLVSLIFFVITSLNISGPQILSLNPTETFVKSF